MGHVIAIDLGGTKTALAVFDEQGQRLDRVVEATSSGDPRASIVGLAHRAAGLAGANQANAVGMALPAIVDDEGVVSWAAPSVAAWQGVELKVALEAAFDVPAVALFDGYAAALGEARFGAGRGYRSLATLIVGTGFGAGVWRDGRVVDGHVGVAGAVGWNRWVLPDGSLSGPAEQVASGTGILAAAREHGRAEDYPDTPAVFRRARQGDAVAASAIHLATAVAGCVAGTIIDLLAPELLVWSGGVGSRADFSRQATRVARQSCQPFASGRTVFTRSRLGSESSLAGAAAMALSAQKGESGS